MCWCGFAFRGKIVGKINVWNCIVAFDLVLFFMRSMSELCNFMISFIVLFFFCLFVLLFRGFFCLECHCHVFNCF